MCGRYASFQGDQDLLDAFLIDPAHGLDADAVAAWRASWNVAPTQPVRIVVERPARTESADAPPVRSLRLARWGLVPSWAKDPSGGARMINARAESLADRPAYREALTARRCLVPADGYYEWSAVTARRKQPYYLRAADGGVLAFAGLYEFWRDRSRPVDDPGRWLVTCAIVTTAATGEMADIHDRRPAILPRGAWDAWLSPGTSAGEALDLLRGPSPQLAWHPVSTAVNAVAHDGPELLALAGQG